MAVQFVGMEAMILQSATAENNPTDDFDFGFTILDFRIQFMEYKYIMLSTTISNKISYLLDHLSC